jgi:hypothetical protein
MATFLKAVEVMVGGWEIFQMNIPLPEQDRHERLRTSQ